LAGIVAGCATVGPAPVKPDAFQRAVFKGTARAIGFWYYVDPDCTSPGNPRIRMVSPPTRGTIGVSQGTRRPNFAPDSLWVECNKRAVPGTVITYQPGPGAVGADTAILDVLYSSGDTRRVEYDIEIADTPAKISGPDPRYPDAARKAGLEGEVLAWVYVDAEGRVANVRIWRSPAEVLSNEVLEALREWRFRPSGAPASLYPFVGKYRVVFRLADRNPTVTQ
jgi:TonB family protein